MPEAAGRARGNRARHAIVAALGGALQARIRRRSAEGEPCSASCRAATMRRCASESARALADIGFDGYAIGGLAVGEPQEVMLKIVAETAPMLPTDRPRYLMGVGTPDDLLQAVARGIDMFDCVLPTRNGRHGMAFTRLGPINLANARHADDARPLDAESAHPAARDLFARLLASSDQGQRNARPGAAVDDQSRLLPRADGRHARGDRGRAVSPISRRRPSAGGSAGTLRRFRLGSCFARSVWLKPRHERSCRLPRQRRKPRFNLPPGATDAHCHVFGPGDKFPYAANRRYTPEDAPKEMLAALHAHLGVERAVIVQASCHGPDNAAMLDCIASDPKRYRGVAIVDDSVHRRRLRPPARRRRARRALQFRQASRRRAGLGGV